VATGYSGPEGATFDDFPYHQSVLHHVRGETVELPGWHEDISGARSLEDLPANAQAYVRFIEEQLGVPVVTVGVGPGREEIIWTKEAARLGVAAAA
jgi:adenylosuccinate synthase